ncbi:SdpI family protein [Sphaerisporangium sp. TRM90804]|uniref:SdpI family protein n=1 Tax=Sphaerisporangium sp. TRM90804 TaxID=3031113 RepID=UPI00244CC003|nr:SdpI family protein [Sphaerisporangium sp. TRM90804]MDH2424042.1 SdpI family protein [Sphaerisporangium sp. TRM90804]
MTMNPADDTRLDLRPGLAGSAVALLVAAGCSVWGWFAIPGDARLPMHWNASGEADRYVSKTQALLELPLIMLGLCVFMAVLPRVLPRRRHMASSARTYTAAWIGVLVLMTGLHAVSVVNGAGGQIPVSRVTVAGVGLLLVVLGNYLPKTRSNWAVGVRTPWTLQSEHSWKRANRMAGWLFVAHGLVVLAVAFLLPLPAVFLVLVVGVVVASVLPVAYSWWAWRSDPRTSEAEAGGR